ncbi:MAG: TonB-dependent receptor [Myxococcota bacterium]
MTPRALFAALVSFGACLSSTWPTRVLAQPEEADTSTPPMTRDDLKYFEDASEAPEIKDGATDERALPSLDPRLMDRVSIFGRKVDSPRIAGSAHLLDDEDLQRFEQNDIHQILSQVPGVYVRGEDGYGLRPNISLRGVDPTRSSKIVLLEDNILLGPAPYSAPAAYYFPLMTRMTGVEVFKGPAAIVTGPNTIGGAINFQTQSIPGSTVAFLDLAGGNDSFAKVHGYAGTGTENWGILVEGVHLRTDGFKELATEAFELADDAGTGFDRNDVMVKARVNTDLSAPVFQQLRLKLGWGSEVSNETYLGLSEADFARNAALRYPASQLDRMTWDRLQAELTHEISQERWRLRTTFYRHDFWRNWRRLDGFGPFGGASINDVLRLSGNEERLATLTGDQNSSQSNETLLITFNDRSFVSQGIQSEFSTQFETGWLRHDVRAGARLHFDRVERDHDSEEYAMERGRMLRTDNPRFATTANRDKALAGAFFLQDQLSVGSLAVVPAVRVELIQIDRAILTDDPGFGIAPNRSQFNAIALPGIGASYGIGERLFVLAGVHRGFSPAAPSSARPLGVSGNPETVPPELSWNVESGLRFVSDSFSAEAIGFANLYENFIVNCTRSAGCSAQDLDDQQDLGGVNTFGVETQLRGQTKLPFGLTGTLGLVYTFTRSTIESDIEDGVVSVFNGAEAGDRFPFLPLHVGSLTGGIGNEFFGLDVTLRGQSRTFDVPEGAIPDEELAPRSAFFSDAFAVLDASARYRPTAWLEIYASGTNLTDARYVVGRRPFGPRPGQTLTVFGGVKLRYGP